MIYRGTTPRLDFTLPFNTDLIDKAYITFHQKDRQAIEKEKSDCEIDTNKLILTLAQADTLKLVSNGLEHIKGYVSYDMYESLS